MCAPPSSSAHTRQQAIIAGRYELHALFSALQPVCSLQLISHPRDNSIPVWRLLKPPRKPPLFCLSLTPNLSATGTMPCYYSSIRLSSIIPRGPARYLSWKGFRRPAYSSPAMPAFPSNYSHSTVAPIMQCTVEYEAISPLARCPGPGAKPTPVPRSCID